MLDERWVELMHGEIDGRNTPAESTELKQLLGRNAAAREEFEQLRELADVLGRVEPLEPPPALRAAVLQDLADNATAHKTRTGERGASRLPAPAQAWRYAYALAAGIILGVLGYQWLGDRGFQGASENEAFGTLAPRSTTAPLATLPVAIDGASGIAELWPTVDGYRVGIRVETEDRLVLRVRFTPEHTSVLGLRRSDTDTALELGDGHLRWVAAGPSRIEILLSQPPAGIASSVGLEYLVNETVVSVGQLPLTGSFAQP